MGVPVNPHPQPHFPAPCLCKKCVDSAKWDEFRFVPLAIPSS